MVFWVEREGKGEMWRDILSPGGGGTLKVGDGTKLVELTSPRTKVRVHKMTLSCDIMFSKEYNKI
jgi:hypothetical protein